MNRPLTMVACPIPTFARGLRVCTTEAAINVFIWPTIPILHSWAIRHGVTFVLHRLDSPPSHPFTLNHSLKLSAVPLFLSQHEQCHPYYSADLTLCSAGHCTFNRKEHQKMKPTRGQFPSQMSRGGVRLPNAEVSHPDPFGGAFLPAPKAMCFQ